MTQKESERSGKSSPLNAMPIELAELSKKRIEEFVNMQSELLDKWQATNRQWLDRAQQEANLASEFAAKLTATRSIPEAMAICQEWASRRFAMLAEDGKRLLADSQDFMAAGARLLSNGAPLNGGGGST